MKSRGLFGFLVCFFFCNSNPHFSWLDRWSLVQLPKHRHLVPFEMLEGIHSVGTCNCEPTGDTQSSAAAAGSKAGYPGAFGVAEIQAQNFFLSSVCIHMLLVF